jgi:hypothetical protein
LCGSAVAVVDLDLRTVGGGGTGHVEALAGQPDDRARAAGGGVEGERVDVEQRAGPRAGERQVQRRGAGRDAGDRAADV